MTSNSAAWLVAAKAHPLEIKPAPYTSPADNEILVKNAAVAVNPVDWAIQHLAIMPYEYPMVFGADVAGEVVEVGKSVTTAKKGDRVLGFALGSVNQRKPESAYQQYTILQQPLFSVIPDSMSFEQASVIPLCIATAAGSLYEQDHLQLQVPSLNPKLVDQTVVIWGGASSVGSNAIQLAVASGYNVLTTASSKNFDYVRNLGAIQVIDYNKESAIDDIVGALEGKTVAGVLDAVAENGAMEAALKLVAHPKFTGKRFVSTVRSPPEDLPQGVSAKWVFSSNAKDNGIGKAIFEDYLPEALAKGKFVAAPDPEVVGKGLEYVQTGIDMIGKGVSRKKLVITL
ncbi:MAG: hypothetical protein Q9174_003374 [Haloplaca sp. 1 TL-2023]